MPYQLKVKVLDNDICGSHLGVTSLVIHMQIYGRREGHC